MPPLVSGWQLAGAADAGGATTAAGAVCADAGDAGACDGAEVACVIGGDVFCTVATGCAAWWLGVPVAVGEALVVRPAVVPVPGEDGVLPEFAAAMMMMIRATTAKIPVSVLWRAGHDLPCWGGGGCRLGGCGGP